MKIGCALGAFVFLLLATSYRSVECRSPFDEFLAAEPAEPPVPGTENGTRWAVLVAGSKGYNNYRHQANVCHAYQILKEGGLKEENIIVFMYDDIAYNHENPAQGFIFNKPFGPNVYHQVPKDYTGNDTNANNLYAVLLGDRSALTGGSGKVLSSGPNDHVFFFYADHGAAGFVGMPVGDPVYAKDLVDVVKKKHQSNGYKRMVMYIEACESGSMLSGLLPDDVNVYGTTASKDDEPSWAFYCPENPRNSTMLSGSPDYLGTCMGDLYSISWLEDSDMYDPRTETLEKQYERVKGRTYSSHVMRYGDLRLSELVRSVFMGPFNPFLGNTTSSHTKQSSLSSEGLVSQHDAKLAYLRHKVQSAPDGTLEKMEAETRLRDELLHRKQVEHKIKRIARLLFGETNGLALANTVRPDGQPLVDDWQCFKTMLRTYEEHCGALSDYGRKYTRVIASICNAGISKEKLIFASAKACYRFSK